MLMTQLLRRLIILEIAAISVIGSSDIFADWGPTIDPERTQTLLPVLSNCINPVFTLTEGGAFSSRVGANTTLPVVDSSTYAYTPGTRSSSANFFGIFLGGEYHNDSSYSTQLGLGYYKTGSF